MVIRYLSPGHGPERVGRVPKGLSIPAYAWETFEMCPLTIWRERMLFQYNLLESSRRGYAVRLCEGISEPRTDIRASAIQYWRNMTGRLSSVGRPFFLQPIFSTFSISFLMISSTWPYLSPSRQIIESSSTCLNGLPVYTTTTHIRSYRLFLHWDIPISTDISSRTARSANRGIHECATWEAVLCDTSSTFLSFHSPSSCHASNSARTLAECF